MANLLLATVNFEPGQICHSDELRLAYMAELEIRKGNRDNSEIIFLVSQ